MNEQILRDRIAFVTGAGSGIGRAVTLKFLEKGATAVGIDLYEDRLKSLEEDAKARGIESSRILCLTGDASSLVAVEKLVSTTMTSFGRIEILVNTAGGSLGFGGIDFIDSEEKQWDETIRTNLYTMFGCTKVVLPHMVDRQYGKIINFGSTVGMGDSASGGDGQAVYGACKAAIIMFTKAVAREVAKYRINVNCITPGLVRTRVTERFPAEVLDSVVKKTPFGRIGEPDDIANVALFLASEQGAWLTGQNICANGGLIMH